MRKGEPWGRAAAGPPEARIEGDDATLAAWASRHLGATVAFAPSESSDFARALGMRGAELELPVDALRWNRGLALNAIVLGTPPDRLRWWSRGRRVRVSVGGRERFARSAVAVVIANGQYLRGRDIVPRGHPGDGRIEVQVYEIAPRERGEMRRRLPRGDHVPHPRIHEFAGDRVEVAVSRGRMALEADGVARGRTSRLQVAVAPAALWVRL